MNLFTMTYIRAHSCYKNYVTFQTHFNMYDLFVSSKKFILYRYMCIHYRNNYATMYSCYFNHRMNVTLSSFLFTNYICTMLQ